MSIETMTDRVDLDEGRAVFARAEENFAESPSEYRCVLRETARSKWAHWCATNGEALMRELADSRRQHIEWVTAHQKDTDAAWRAVNKAERESKAARAALEAIRSEIDGMADAEAEGGRFRPNVFMRIDTIIDAVLPQQVNHVCGLSGYNGMIDPPCPACTANEHR